MKWNSKFDWENFIYCQLIAESMLSIIISFKKIIKQLNDIVYLAKL